LFKFQFQEDQQLDGSELYVFSITKDVTGNVVWIRVSGCGRAPNLGLISWQDTIRILGLRKLRYVLFIEGNIPVAAGTTIWLAAVTSVDGSRVLEATERDCRASASPLLTISLAGALGSARPNGSLGTLVQFHQSAAMKYFPFSDDWCWGLRSQYLVET